jgi:hypothetical protein
VFHFDAPEYEEKIEDWISGFEMRAGSAFRKEIETHIRDEYSTFGWILEGMITRAGFVIEKSMTTDGFVTEYLCRKVEEKSGSR